MFTLRFQTWHRWKKIRWSLARDVGSKKGQIRLGGKAGPWPGLQLTALGRRARDTLDRTWRDACAGEKGAQCAEALNRRLALSALSAHRRSPGSSTVAAPGQAPAAGFEVLTSAPCSQGCPQVRTPF